MNLDDVAFPALVVADDGWVDYLESEKRFSTWTPAAIAKYRRRRVLLYDSDNQGWEIENIAPEGNRLGLVARILNSRIPVRITVRPLRESPLQAVQTALSAAIDADDDILAQFADRTELTDAVQRSRSFEALVRTLRAKRAI